MDRRTTTEREAATSRPGRPETGSVAVETAIILPLMLLFIMGLIELSNMFRIVLGLQYAAQQGTMVAVTGEGEVEGDRLARIQAAVNAYIASMELAGDPPTITVQSWPGVDASGDGRANDAGDACDMVEVRVDYDYRPITPLAGVASLFGGTFGEEYHLDHADRRVNEPWQPCN